MPYILCAICRYARRMIARVAGMTTMYQQCTHGVSGAPYRTECPVFVREGADDEWPSVRLRGRLPLATRSSARHDAAVDFLSDEFFHLVGRGHETNNKRNLGILKLICGTHA
jgi:hypothetical protein